MSKEVDQWVRSAQADFKAAGHKGACPCDLETMCLQIEDMVQSIALGLSELTEVVRLTKNRIEHIEGWIEAQESAQENRPAQVASARCAMAR